MRRVLAHLPLRLIVVGALVAAASSVGSASAAGGAPSSAARGGLRAVAGPLVRASSWDGDLHGAESAGVEATRGLPAMTIPIATTKRSLAGAAAPAPSPAAPEGPTSRAPMPAATTFAGLGKSSTCGTKNCGSGWPPDTVGDVGPTNYVEAVNTAIGVFDKSGTKLKAMTFNTLFSSLPSTTPCRAHNQGDPTVIYDVLNDRWIVADFAFRFDSFGFPTRPFYECIAASKTPDPTAGWWRFAVRTDPGGTGRPPQGTLADYPKMGLWPDTLFMGANLFRENGSFAGTGFWAFNLADLESGSTLHQLVKVLGPSVDSFTPLPANLRGSLPPDGTPEYFVSQSLQLAELRVRTFAVEWVGTPSGSLGTAKRVDEESYFVTDPIVVPQRDTANKLDSLMDRLMMQAQYRNIEGIESLWVVHTVRTSGSSPTAIQWTQADVSGGIIHRVPVQVQTFTNGGDRLYRFMPSLAVDQDGDMAVGYSRSGSRKFPSIMYAGRLASDPLGQLPQVESAMTLGGGSQTNKCGGAPCHRWGDYTTMTVDPVDDCTFWYVGQYYANQTQGTKGNWQTSIGSFKFPDCGTP
jgi:hypothetical protein